MKKNEIDTAFDIAKMIAEFDEPNKYFKENNAVATIKFHKDDPLKKSPCIIISVRGMEYWFVSSNKTIKKEYTSIMGDKIIKYIVPYDGWGRPLGQNTAFESINPKTRKDAKTS